MKTYWHRHPRGFANECTLVVCTTDDDAAILERNGYTQLDDAREAYAHWRWIQNENLAWNSKQPTHITRPKQLPRNWDQDACHKASDLIAELELS